MARPLRYTAILVLVAACAALAAFGGWRFARASAPINGPVVLISVDALRADRLPVYGHSQGNTPAIDLLAADGLIFDRAYANAPLTLPSHTSLLSGRLPFATGVRNNAGFVVDEGNRMLAEILRDRGYATGAVVSSFALRRATGIDQGFAFFDDGAADAGRGGPLIGSTGAWRAGRNDAAAEQIAERWLTSTRSPRAFLFLHLFGPHGPRRNAGDTPGAAYDAAVSDADEVVGRLVKYLKANQLYDQSTIILVSDHGEGLGDHGEEAHGLLVYDEALRVPFIVKPAASEVSGRRVADVVQLADIAPTVLDLARAPVPGDLAGRSLTPLIENGVFPARVVYSESMYPLYAFGWSGLTTVTDGRFRYIAPFPAGPVGRAPSDPAPSAGAIDPSYEKTPSPAGAELFDHESDPHEQTNLLGVSEPAALATLKAALERLTSNAASQDPTAVSAEDHEQYKALGYVGVSTFRATTATVASAFTSEVSHPRDKTRVVNTWRAAVDSALVHDWSAALSFLTTALELEPVNADLWAEVARFSVSAGRHDDALAALKKLDALDPSTTVTKYLEARTMQARGRHQQAAAAFELALAGQAEPGARMISGMRSSAAESLTALYRYEEAEHLLLEEASRFPHNAKARAGLASLYQATGRNDEAAVVLADLVHQIPTAEAHDLAARVWTALGQPKEAAVARSEARRLAQYAQ